MIKNEYYQTVLKKDHSQSFVIVQIGLWLAQWLSMPLRVFTRKRFGERYFMFSGVCILLASFAYAPFALDKFLRPPIDYSARHYPRHELEPNGYPYQHNPQSEPETGDNSFRQHRFEHEPEPIDWGGYFKRYFTLYLFTGLCFWFALKRKKEIDRSPSAFDFGHYSYAMGTVWPWFYTIKIKGKKPDIRQVETMIEPAFFFLIGLVLSYFHQIIGYYIAFAAFLMWWHIRSMYKAGDNFLLDKIDEMICNEELATTFLSIHDEEDGNRGFRFYGHRPSDEGMREKLAGSFLYDDEAVEIK